MIRPNNHIDGARCKGVSLANEMVVRLRDASDRDQGTSEAASQLARYLTTSRSLAVHATATKGLSAALWILEAGEKHVAGAVVAAGSRAFPNANTAAAAAASTCSTGASARRCREPPGAWGRRLGRDCSTSEAIGLRRSNSSTWLRLPLWRPRARLPLALPPSLASPKQSGKTPAGPPNRHSCHARWYGLQP